MKQTFFGTFPLNDYSLYASLMSTHKDNPGIKIITTYAIVNKRTGQAYIGATESFLKRWRKHHWGLSTGVHPNDMLQAAYDDEPDAFEIKIISHLDTTTGLIDREVEAGFQYDVTKLYNYKLGNMWINGHCPLRSTGIKSGGYAPKKKSGKLSVTRWFDSGAVKSP